MPDFSYIKDGEERFKKDLKFQLKFERVDWDYFIATARTARIAQEARDEAGEDDVLYLELIKEKHAKITED